MSLVTPLPPALAALVNSAIPADPSATPQPPAAAQITIAKLETETNPDGSITTTTLYSDGRRTTAIQPNPNPTHATSPLGATQLAPLLAAQESRSQTPVAFGQSPYATIR